MESPGAVSAPLLLHGVDGQRGAAAGAGGRRVLVGDPPAGRAHAVQPADRLAALVARFHTCECAPVESEGDGFRTPATPRPGTMDGVTSTALRRAALTA